MKRGRGKSRPWFSEASRFHLAETKRRNLKAREIPGWGGAWSRGRSQKAEGRILNANRPGSTPAAERSSGQVRTHPRGGVESGGESPPESPLVSPPPSPPLSPLESPPLSPPLSGVESPGESPLESPPHSPLDSLPESPPLNPPESPVESLPLSPPLSPPGRTPLNGRNSGMSRRIGWLG